MNKLRLLIPRWFECFIKSDNKTVSEILDDAIENIEEQREIHQMCWLDLRRIGPGATRERLMAAECRRVNETLRGLLKTHTAEVGKIHESTE